MRLTLCNEVVREMLFARQCALAASLGYAGLEVAPFTLDAEAPHLLGATWRQRLRATAAEEGIAITGLHWLLVAPDGLSITSADPAVRARTLDVMQRLIGLCADLGGSYLVHGSPAQRRVEGPDDAARAEAALAQASQSAEDMRAGIEVTLKQVVSAFEKNHLREIAPQPVRWSAPAPRA